jgi:hypothetical protein
MTLETREAVFPGVCDYCPQGAFDAGEFVAEPFDGEIMCPECVAWFRQWWPVFRASAEEWST